MSKHTEGPWKWMNDNTLVGDHGKRPVVLTVQRIVLWDSGVGAKEVAYCLAQRGEDGRIVPFDPDSLDGKLIASAPELLEALRKLQQRVCDEWCARHEVLGRSHHPSCQEARDVIREAEGTR